MHTAPQRGRSIAGSLSLVEGDIALTVDHAAMRYTVATCSARRLGLHSGPCALSRSPFCGQASGPDNYFQNEALEHLPHHQSGPMILGNDASIMTLAASGTGLARCRELRARHPPPPSTPFVLRHPPPPDVFSPSEQVARLFPSGSRSCQLFRDQQSAGEDRDQSRAPALTEAGPRSCIHPKTSAVGTQLVSRCMSREGLPHVRGKSVSHASAVFQIPVQFLYEYSLFQHGPSANNPGKEQSA